jgi:hypothetical protein
MQEELSPWTLALAPCDSSEIQSVCRDEWLKRMNGSMYANSWHGCNGCAWTCRRMMEPACACVLVSRLVNGIKISAFSQVNIFSQVAFVIHNHIQIFKFLVATAALQVKGLSKKRWHLDSKWVSKPQCVRKLGRPDDIPNSYGAVGGSWKSKRWGLIECSRAI